MAVACLLHSKWGLPGPGIDTVSPALAGRFSTTEPPGKPLRIFLFVLRGVLGSQQNWEDVTGISHIPCALHIHTISSYQHPPPEWKWKSLHQWSISIQSTEFTLGFITSTAYSIGLDKCIMTSIHYYGIIQYFQCLDFSFCALPIHCSPTQMVVATDLFTISIV